MKTISSPHNALIRHAEQLQRKSRARKKHGMFLIEGKREIRLALEGGYVVTEALICPEILYDRSCIEETVIRTDFGFDQGVTLTMVTLEVYDRLAYRGGCEGCIAFAKAKTPQVSRLKLNPLPLVLVAEAMEKPGNLGALLRTADAAQVDAVLLVDSVVDVYNPNVVRSSVGCLFTVDVLQLSREQLLTFLSENKMNLYTATLQNSNRYDLVDYTAGCAIAVGAESTGLSKEMRDAATSSINIPMLGHIDSMNVSVSAAIIIYEARRQRGF